MICLITNPTHEAINMILKIEYFSNKNEVPHRPPPSNSTQVGTDSKFREYKESKKYSASNHRQAKIV